jgi:hypothetical protein
MVTRKDGINQNLEERNRGVSSDYERVKDEDNLDTREISHDVEEGDEDYDDEELENEELTEDDFDVDDDDEEEEEEGII